MGKTHEALLRAEREHGQKFLIPVPDTNRAPVVWDPLYGISQMAPEWFKELKTRLEFYRNGQKIKSILFTSTSLQEVCTSVSAGFAKCLSVNFQKRVLLMDVNIRKPEMRNFFRNEYIQDINEFLESDQPAFRPTQEGTPCNLQVMSCSRQDEEMVNLFASSRFNQLLSTAQEVFDYIIIDSSPITLFSETRIISAKVDGVILVIEAGKTRRQSAIKAKKEIDEAGGVLLGSVLNKRKFYVPKWLYRRL